MSSNFAPRIKKNRGETLILFFEKDRVVTHTRSEERRRRKLVPVDESFESDESGNVPAKVHLII